MLCRPPPFASQWWEARAHSMARSVRILLAVTALAVAVVADKSPHASAVQYGYGYGYKPFSYGYGVHQPYRQKTNVHHYQHGLGYGYGIPYGYGHHYGYPYRYGHQYGYGYSRPAYSHVKYSGYPASYALHVAHSKVHPNKYADHKPAYAYKPARFGYTSTVVHPAGTAVLHPAVGYGKPGVLYGKAQEKAEEDADVMADDESASGDEMMAEEVMAEESTQAEDGQ